MLTPRLEKAILNGMARYNVVSHALSGFARIEFPENSILIITHIKWFPFLNPILFQPGTMTYRDLFRYNEYQLKVDANKSLNYFHFRNEFPFKILGGQTIDLSTVIDAAFTSKFFLPEQGRPIQQDTYIVCERFCKLTITRNSFIHNITTNFTPLSPKADEKNTPNGIQGIPTLNTAFLTEPGGSKMRYLPPGQEYIQTYTPDSRNTEPYKQDYEKPYSFISDIDYTKPITAVPQLVKDFPYHTTPLIELGIVTINNDNFQKIMND